MSKSHVSLEQKACVICGELYETNAVLLDKKLKPSLEKHTVTGWGLCKTHQELKNKGYVALIGCNNTGGAEGYIKADNANRTGEVAHVRNEVFTKIFDVEPPKHGVVFVQNQIIQDIKKATNNE